jgi:hypothetical protein
MSDMKMEEITEVTMTLVFDVNHNTSIRELQEIMETFKKADLDVDCQFRTDACSIEVSSVPTEVC